jgi:tripartite-type tricarboxylate transporter receptor subunit TctC
MNSRHSYRRLTLKSIALGSAAAAGGLALAQTSDRPIKVIIPFAGGNTLDIALRHVGEVFKQNTGQSIVVESKPGGGGIIAAQALMQSAPDGTTLLLANTSMLTINPHTYSKLPYDAEKSFKPVTNFLGAAMVMAVHSSVPANNVKEFVAWVKANPGKVSFASFTAGNSSHFAGVILNQRAGLDMVHVPHNGTPPAVQNLVGGQVQAAFLPLLAVRPHIESGKVKVLAITSPERSALMPSLATFREQGYPELDIYIWTAVVAPAATPDAVIARLNTEFIKALRNPEVVTKWAAMGFEPLPSSPDEFVRFAQGESKRWGEAVKLSGFKATE